MNQADSIAVFAIATTLVMSLVYFFLLELIKPSTPPYKPFQLLNLFLVRKISGFFLFGIIPLVVLSVFFHHNITVYGGHWGDAPGLWVWIAGISVILVALNIFNSRNASIQAMYPELRITRWTNANLSLNIMGWVIYLAGYEFMFRGLLLFSCYDAFGLWPAIAINLALYSALHLPKGMKEAIGAIPFGALICYLTLESQSIIPAIALHSIQAISCEITCIIRNPKMKLTFKN